MNKNSIKKLLSVLMITVSVAATALMVSCSSDNAADNSSAPTSAVTSAVTSQAAQSQHSFTFTVEFADGTKKDYNITTDETYVGAALQKEGLIAGEESETGLYVKTVAGETHDYDVDKTYWAFYVGDEYATKVVDSTEIVEGTTYKFAVGQ